MLANKQNIKSQQQFHVFDAALSRQDIDIQPEEPDLAFTKAPNLKSRMSPVHKFAGTGGDSNFIVQPEVQNQ